MMRWFKKIVRAFLALLPVFAFFFFTSPTYALRYDVDSFILPRFTQCDPYSSLCSSTPPTSYEFSEDLVPSGNLDFRAFGWLSASYNDLTGKCDYSNYYHPGYYRSDNKHLEYSAGPFYFPYNLNYYNTLVESGFHNNNIDYFRCRNMLAFGSSFDLIDFSIPQFDSGSIPPNTSINASSMLPYHYMFANLGFNTDRVVDGFHYYSGFDLSELILQEPRSGDGNDDLLYYTSKIKSVSFNLNFNSSLEPINAGSSVLIEGSFDLGDTLSQSDFDNLGLKFTINNAGSQYASQSCSLAYDLNYSNIINYSCSVTNSSQYDFDSYVIYMTIRSNGVALASSDFSWRFNNISVTLNSDSSYGGLASVEQTGSFPNTAPGMADIHNDSQINWNASLSSLFGFSFLNPFGGLFALFSDSSTCVSIPIIAGMLNAEETSYCPWFSADIRSILTPVLGIVGLMLVFGFVVRWLGSSSGNMFEDQTSHKWGNTQIKQKGVK